MLPDAPAFVTVHDAPPTAGLDRSGAWMEGRTYDQFLRTAQKYVEMWQGIYQRAVIPTGVLERLAAVPSRWHLLVISEDWCIDAPATVAVMARMADAAPNLDLRLLGRDDHLDLMDEHLTGGTARAIPIAILLDEELVERAWWGPRPAPLQAWVKTQGVLLADEERYRRIRQWYARDAGRTTLDEVAGMIERAAAG